MKLTNLITGLFNAWVKVAMVWTIGVIVITIIFVGTIKSKNSISDKTKKIIITTALILEDRYKCFEKNEYSNRLENIVKSHSKEIAVEFTKKAHPNFTCKNIVEMFPLDTLELGDYNYIRNLQSNTIDLEIGFMSYSDSNQDIHECPKKTQVVFLAYGGKYYTECNLHGAGERLIKQMSQSYSGLLKYIYFTAIILILPPLITLLPGLLPRYIRKLKIRK